MGGILHIVWAVNANWNAGNGWNVNANPVDNPNPWNDENQVLSRNSLHSGDFLKEWLSLELHPDKISIKTFASGVDFLGWVHFPSHRVLRTTTKRRMIRRIQERKGNKATLQSYRGLLSHGNAKKLQKFISG